MTTESGRLQSSEIMLPMCAAGEFPIRTVGMPVTMVPPPQGFETGGKIEIGISKGVVVLSPNRAAGEPPIKTVGDPVTIFPPVAVLSPERAAGPPAKAPEVVTARVRPMSIL